MALYVAHFFPAGVAAKINSLLLLYIHVLMLNVCYHAILISNYEFISKISQW